MARKIDFDDLIRQGEDIKALRYLAKELYNNNMIGGTRKRLLERVADGYEKIEENEAYASSRAIELIHENEKLKQEIENLKYKILFLSEKAIEEQQEVEAELEDFKNKYLNILMEMQELKIALQKCSPIGPKTLVEETGVWCFCCKFCRQIQASDTKEFHTDDCEYVRLTGGTNDKT